MSDDVVDVVVVGAGPNGLVAAALLARAGMEVVVLEAAAEPGGAVRSAELTLPGFVHDQFSAFYGLLHLSPVLAELGLERRVQWARCPHPVGAATAPGRAAVIHADAAATLAALGRRSATDAAGYRRLLRLLDAAGDDLLAALLAPLPAAVPGLRLLRRLGPRGLAGLAQLLLAPLEEVVARLFETEEARALVAAGATHADVGVDAAGSVPVALVLAHVAQRAGMPVPVGGAGRLAAALAASVGDAGGRLRTGVAVRRVVVAGGRAVGVETAAGERLRARHAVVADCDAGRLGLDLVGAEHLPTGYLAGLRRRPRRGAMFKLDLALAGPAPWLVGELHSTSVVHVTGPLAETATAQHEVRRGLLPRRPQLVVGQQSLADPGRAPAGAATLWVECQVPPAPCGDAAGELRDVTWPELAWGFTARLVERLERHAPGLRGSILGARPTTPAALEAADPNLVGGDVNGGSSGLDQQLLLRPVAGWGGGYRLPLPGLYLCSASAHPGGGVHGMGGRSCARAVLRDSTLAGRALGAARGLARAVEARTPPPPLP